MHKLLLQFLNDWYSGNGARFAHRVKETIVAGMTSKSYTPDLDDLVPDSSLTQQLGIIGMGVRFAVGADDQSEIRIELEYSDRRESHRWRPADMSIVRRAGQSHRRVSKAVLADHMTKRADTSVDAREIVSVLKSRRFELADIEEAGGNTSELAQIEPKLNAARVVNRALKENLRG
jgi:hypothetical protein